MEKTSYKGVYKRGATYTYIIDLPPDPQTGKRRQKGKGGFKTARDANKARTEELSKIYSGTYTEDNNMTYEELLHIWLQDYAKPNLKPTVYEINKVIIEKRIMPELGKKKLKELTPLQIQRFYNKLLETYSPDYVKSIHNVVSKTLRQAFKWDMLPTNIMEKVDPPKIRRKEMNIWTMDQCKHFLEVAKDNPYYIAFNLAIYTGMRRGEVLGLRWKDIDFERKTLSVQQTVSWTSSEGIVFQETKTSNSNRSISLPDALINDLLERKKVVDELKSSNKNYAKYDLVVAYPDGNPVKPRYLLEQFTALIEKSGLPRIRFHDLRHSHATMLIQLNVHPKIGAERLGQTTSMFMDRYAHVIESMQKEVADLLDQNVGKYEKPVDR